MWRLAYCSRQVAQRSTRVAQRRKHRGAKTQALSPGKEPPGNPAQKFKRSLGWQNALDLKSTHEEASRPPESLPLLPIPPYGDALDPGSQSLTASSLSHTTGLRPAATAAQLGVADAQAGGGSDVPTTAEHDPHEHSPVEPGSGSAMKGPDSTQMVRWPKDAAAVMVSAQAAASRERTVSAARAAAPPGSEAALPRVMGGARGAGADADSDVGLPRDDEWADRRSRPRQALASEGAHGAELAGTLRLAETAPGGATSGTVLDDDLAPGRASQRLKPMPMEAGTWKVVSAAEGDAGGTRPVGSSAPLVLAQPPSSCAVVPKADAAEVAVDETMELEDDDPERE